MSAGAAGVFISLELHGKSRHCAYCHKEASIISYKGSDTRIHARSLGASIKAVYRVNRIPVSSMSS